jgi:hypothetical protein
MSQGSDDAYRQDLHTQASCQFIIFWRKYPNIENISKETAFKLYKCAFISGMIEGNKQAIELFKEFESKK